MPFLAVTGVHKSFGATPVLAGVELAVEAGEIATLLGPSGCGKTTLLRILAGLELPDRGDVVLEGRSILGDPAERRPVNTVFQSYALFPHLDVAENLAFGLVSRRVPRDERRRRVDEMLALFRLDGLGERRPEQLSGGQRQRVAMARALVNQPKLLLLDEPMSALDARLRAELQLELRGLKRRLGTTMILVTHDQDEAMAVSDRVFVMNRGRVEQAGPPAEVYAAPRSRFVADFLGAANVLSGAPAGPRAFATALGTFALDRDVPPTARTIAIRPEQLRPAAAGEVNALELVVTDAVFRGDHVDVVGEPGGLSARLPPGERPAPGARRWFRLPPDALVVLDD